VIVLEPGLVIYKIYNGYWFFGRLTLGDLRQDLLAVSRNAGRTGTSQHPNSKRRGSKAARNSSIRMTKRTPKLAVNRINSGIAISSTLRRDRPGLIAAAKLFVG
jgi:hypothetical protein